MFLEDGSGPVGGVERHVDGSSPNATGDSVPCEQLRQRKAQSLKLFSANADSITLVLAIVSRNFIGR